MASPLYADELLALIRRALMSPGNDACKVYVEVGGDLALCTARITLVGDIILTPTRVVP